VEKTGQLVMAIFGGIIALAIVAVIFSRKAQTPEVLQAASSALANVVSAAVNPIATASTNGDPTKSTFTTPGFTPPIGGADPSAILHLPPIIFNPMGQSAGPSIPSIPDTTSNYPGFTTQYSTFGLPGIKGLPGIGNVLDWFRGS
jgi:hypothetical protein